jgi:hypothetical protein
MVGRPGKNDDPWLDLVVSILAVNTYSLEQAYRCVDGLRQRGLFDPSKLGAWDQPEIVRQLKLAGYERGEYMTNLFALRLMALGVYVSQNGIEISAAVISGGDRAAVQRFLTPVNGIGPKVLENFFLLRGI